MSHYVAIVIVEPELYGDRAGIESRVEELLARYDENLDAEPYKRYDSEGETEQAIKNYGSEEEYLKNIEDWHGHPGGKDEQGIYYWSTYNSDSKWDWYSIGGRWNGGLTNNFPEITDEEATAAKRAELLASGIEERRLELTEEDWVGKPNPDYDPVRARDSVLNNICRVKDVKQDFGYAIVTPDGEWHSKGRMGWFAVSLDEVGDWEQTRTNLLAQYPEHVAVLVDLHI